MTSPMSLMSDLSKRNFEDAFHRAAKTNLVRRPDDDISIARLEAHEKSSAPGARILSQ